MKKKTLEGILWKFSHKCRVCNKMGMCGINRCTNMELYLTEIKELVVENLPDAKNEYYPDKPQEKSDIAHGWNKYREKAQHKIKDIK